MKEKISAIILATVLSLSVAVSLTACDSDPDPSPETPNENGSEENNNGWNLEEGTERETGSMSDLVKNFWQSDTMYDETVMFVAETDEEGNVVSAPRGKLLFSAETILSVKQYVTNSDEPILYTEGVDFFYSEGYLVAYGSVTENLGKKVFSGTIPYVTDKALTGEESFPGVSSSTTVPSKTAGLYLPFTEGTGIVSMQCSVTYTHSEKWTGAVPSYYGDGALQRTVEKLKNKESVELFVWGDSISTGANSSSVLNMAPYMKTWPELLVENLSSYYGADVKLTNKAVGGWSSNNGVGGGSGYVDGVLIEQAGLSALFKNDMPDYVPDVALIGFGMNDASGDLPAERFVENILSMISTLRVRNPNCEIILIGTMLANPLAVHAKNQTELTGYLKNIAKIEKYHCCVVDIGAMHQDLLNAQKRYTEMSSNNVNHPNDFLARIYAMNLLSAFIETKEES